MGEIEIPCQICNEFNSKYIAFCEIDEKIRPFLICCECKIKVEDKIPYKIIPYG